jgi:hypothetical protein
MTTTCITVETMPLPYTDIQFLAIHGVRYLLQPQGLEAQQQVCQRIGFMGK